MPPKKTNSHGVTKSRIKSKPKPTPSKPLRDVTNSVKPPSITPVAPNPNAVNVPSTTPFSRNPNAVNFPSTTPFSRNPNAVNVPSTTLVAENHNGVNVLSTTLVAENRNGVNVPSITPVAENPNGVDEPLDQLLLVHSHLSHLIHQIDELVVQAIQSPGEKDRKEIQAFADVLAEMEVSLKPYVKRFQETPSSSNLVPETNLKQSSPDKSNIAVNEDANTSVYSPVETKWESLVSPSPLVSWRPNSNVDGSRHLFLLTPLPLPKSFTSKCQNSVNSLFENSNMGATVQPFSLNIEDNTGDILMKDMQTPRKVLDSNMTKTENKLKIHPASPSDYSMRRRSMLFATPRLKTSPPKSCVLLEPIPELHHKVMIHKSTPFPRKNQNSYLFEDVESPTSSGHQPSECAEALNNGIGLNERNRKVFEESPKWLMTPPKTCVLLELPKEKSFTSVANECHLQQTALFTDQSNKLPLLNEKISMGKDAVMVKSCKRVNPGRPSEIIESTPLWKEPQSNLQSGKRPGENTLKRELWVKFEAATSEGCRFLDRLEEVSSDEQSPANDH